VIGRLHDGGVIVAFVQQERRCGRRCGSGVAALGLKDNEGVNTDRFQLCAHNRFVRFAGDDHGSADILHALQSQDGLLKTGEIADERGELLGEIAPRDRPQS
jgi:hypothetical protein